MLRRRHAFEEGYQQADYQLIKPIEMSELKCSLFPTTYLKGNGVHLRWATYNGTANSPKS